VRYQERLLAEPMLPLLQARGDFKIHFPLGDSTSDV
jgi:hypothetical protein